MNRVVTTGAAVAAAVAGGVAARRMLTHRWMGNWPMDGHRRGGERRWHVLTINRPLDQVAPDGQLPEPLRELGDDIEVQLRAAPADRGTEVAVRLRREEPSGAGEAIARVRGDDPHQAVRRALRAAKQLVETGEILQPDKPGTTRRTPLNRPLEFATRHGREEGLL
jgi:hypothetical protein